MIEPGARWAPAVRPKGSLPDVSARLAVSGMPAVTVLVGRDAERDRLRAALADAAAGAPRALAIRGDPGVGKTRLLDAAVADPLVAGAVPDHPGRRPRGRERDPLRRAVAAARAAARRHHGPPPAPGHGPGGGAEPRPRGGRPARRRGGDAGAARARRRGAAPAGRRRRRAQPGPAHPRGAGVLGAPDARRADRRAAHGAVRAPTRRPRWSAGSGPCRSCPSVGSTWARPGSCSGRRRRCPARPGRRPRATRWPCSSCRWPGRRRCRSSRSGSAPGSCAPTSGASSGLPDATRRALLLVAVAGSADDAVAEALAEQGLDFGDLEPAEAADLLGPRRPRRPDGRHRSALPPPADPQRGLPRRRAGPETRGAPGARRRARPAHGPRSRRAPGLPPRRGDPGHGRGRGRAAHRRSPQRGRPQQPRHRARAPRACGAAEPVGPGAHPQAAGGGAHRADRRQRRGGDPAARPGPGRDRRPRADHDGVPPAVPRADVERPADRGPRRAAAPGRPDPGGRPGPVRGDAQPGRAAEPDDRRPASRPRRGGAGGRGRAGAAGGGADAGDARSTPWPSRSPTTPPGPGRCSPRASPCWRRRIR